MMNELMAERTTGGSSQPSSSSPSGHWGIVSHLVYDENYHDDDDICPLLLDIAAARRTSLGLLWYCDVKTMRILMMMMMIIIIMMEQDWNTGGNASDDNDWTSPDGSHGEKLWRIVLGLQVGALATVPLATAEDTFGHVFFVTVDLIFSIQALYVVVTLE